MKSLYTVSIEQWRVYAPQVATRKLVEIIRSINDIIQDKRDMMPKEQISDLLRKESVARRVLQERKYLQDKDLADYRKYMNKTHNKKVF